MTARKAWTGPDPQEITAWTLVQASHVVARRFTAALGEVGLTPAQFGILLQLDLYPDMGNGEMARTVLVTPQAMSELLAVLQRLGHVERDLPATRGRRKPARLTTSGRQTLERCVSAVADVERSLGLTSEQSVTLNELLHVITR